MKIHRMPIRFCGFLRPCSIDRAGQIGQGRGQALMTLFGEVSGWAEASRLTEGLIDAGIVH